MIVLPEDKTSHLVDWTSKLLQDLHTTQGELESLVGMLISVSLAVWQSPLHYQALQRTLLESLRHGRNADRTIKLNHKFAVDLCWLSAKGLRSNKVCSWCMSRPDVTVWSDAIPWAGSAVNDDGFFFQKNWDKAEAKCHINFWS